LQVTKYREFIHCIFILFGKFYFVWRGLVLIVRSFTGIQREKLNANDPVMFFYGLNLTWKIM